MTENEQVGITHKKAEFSEWFSEVIAKAELADLRYNVKGFLVHRPWSVLAMKEMYRLYEQELEKRGHEPVWFPAVIPESNFRKEATHIENFSPEVFWIRDAGSGGELAERLALRPTSETAMYQMYALWIRSHRDLPLKLYQSCQVWRYETKATRPFIRGREFHWIEAHDVFATKKEADQQVREDMAMTEAVMHRQFGIPFIFFRRPQWDKFPGAVETYAADTIMPDGRILQQPSTHFLGQNFSKPFGITFMDREEKEEHVWQTCYGPCIWRMFASVIALHGDDKGLMFPFAIAPVQVVIVPVGSPEKSVSEYCKAMEDALVKTFRVRTDLSDRMAGWKFNQWEMKGVPVRLEIGPRELKEKAVTLVRRDTGKKEKVSRKELVTAVEKVGDEITAFLIARADEAFKKSMHSTATLEELRKALEQGGLVRAEFCSVGPEGEACAEKIKEKYHGHVRGVRADKPEKPKGSCMVCGKKAKEVVYIGKQY